MLSYFAGDLAKLNFEHSPSIDSQPHGMKGRIAQANIQRNPELSVLTSIQKQSKKVR